LLKYLNKAKRHSYPFIFRRVVTIKDDADTSVKEIEIPSEIVSLVKLEYAADSGLTIWKRIWQWRQEGTLIELSSIISSIYGWRAVGKARFDDFTLGGVIPAHWESRTIVLEEGAALHYYLGQMKRRSNDLHLSTALSDNSPDMSELVGLINYQLGLFERLCRQYATREIEGKLRGRD
jgi:hypothetical protein